MTKLFKLYFIRMYNIPKYNNNNTDFKAASAKFV